jgi:hypothetical protein
MRSRISRCSAGLAARLCVAGVIAMLVLLVGSTRVSLSLPTSVGTIAVMLVVGRAVERCSTYIEFSRRQSCPGWFPVSPLAPGMPV